MKISKKTWMILGVLLIIVFLILIYSYTSSAGEFKKSKTIEPDISSTIIANDDGDIPDISTGIPGDSGGVID